MFEIITYILDHFSCCVKYLLIGIFCLLSRILIKVCVVLRNRFQEVRDVARGTLVKIIETLGCRYLQYLLKEMQGVLVKGYQVGRHTGKQTCQHCL